MMECERCHAFLRCWACKCWLSCNENKNLIERQECFECSDEKCERGKGDGS